MSRTKIHNLKDFQRSNLNWDVEKRPIYDSKGKVLPVKGTFRTDNNDFLGVVTNNYKVIQNREIFNFIDRLQENGLNMECLRSDSFQGGRSVFAEFDLKDFSLDVGNVGDIVNTSLIVRAMHDGSGSFSLGLNTKRLICTNGMTLPTKHSIDYVRHTQNAPLKIEGMYDTVGLLSSEIENFFALLNSLAKIKLSVPVVGKIVNNIFQNDEGIMSNVAENKALTILNNFETNDNNTFKKQSGTAYALLNAVTNYTDHSVNYRPSNNETAQQGALRGMLFGTGEVLKMKALYEITKIITSEMPSAKLPVKSLKGIL